MRVTWLALILAGALCGGCSSDLLSAQGEPCNSSEECAPGLLCDYGKPPKDKSAGRGTCGQAESVGRDMSAAASDGAVPDLASPNNTTD